MDELDNYEIVRREVRKTKQASSLPVYVLTHYRDINIRTRNAEGLSTIRKESGTIVCGGNKKIKNIGFRIAEEININRQSIQELSEINVASKENKHIKNGYFQKKDISIAGASITATSKPLVCSKELKYRRVV